MRIVIDLQWAQWGYSAHQPEKSMPIWVEELIQNRGNHEVFLVLNGTDPEQIAPIRATFAGLLPAENIRAWHPPGSAAINKPTAQWLGEVINIIRHACLLQLKPDIVFIPFNLQGCSLGAVHPSRMYHPDLRTVIALDESPKQETPETSMSPPVKDLTHLKGADMIFIPPSMMAEDIHMRSDALLETIKTALPNASSDPARSDEPPWSTSIFCMFEELKKSAIRPLSPAGKISPKLA